MNTITSSSLKCALATLLLTVAASANSNAGTGGSIPSPDQEFGGPGVVFPLLGHTMLFICVGSWIWLLYLGLFKPTSDAGSISSRRTLTVVSSIGALVGGILLISS